MNNKNKNIKSTKLSPILKWTGGKGQELKYIHPLIPREIKNYYEPFVGGGAVYFSIRNFNNLYINDKSNELVSLYNTVAKNDKVFFRIMDKIIKDWATLQVLVEENDIFFINHFKSSKKDEDVILWIDTFIKKNNDILRSMSLLENNNNFIDEVKKNILNKIKRMNKIQLEKGIFLGTGILENIESSLKSAFYMHIRYVYNNLEKYKINHSLATAIFFMIRNYAYCGMFRYNKNGNFNVPYGGIGYNRKNLAKKMDYLQSKELIAHLQKTTIHNLDFLDFFKKNKPKRGDFIFLDPPYDSTFSTYSQNEFNRKDQTRLAEFLMSCDAKWLMIIKNTDFIKNLYCVEGVFIKSFHKKYLINIKNKNNRETEHLIITNYLL